MLMLWLCFPRVDKKSIGGTRRQQHGPPGLKIQYCVTCCSIIGIPNLLGVCTLQFPNERNSGKRVSLPERKEYPHASMKREAFSLYEFVIKVASDGHNSIGGYSREQLYG